jgi:signal transduction histidine kinase
VPARTRLGDEIRIELTLSELRDFQRRAIRVGCHARRDAAQASLENAPSVDDVQGLVRTLNNFRQLRAGELRLRSVETDLVDIVHAAPDDARRQMPRRRLLVHTLPLACVVCDPGRMRQVLDQVLDEARRRTRWEPAPA